MFGIVMTEMPETVFRWTKELSIQEKAKRKTENEVDIDGWSMVVRKKRKANAKYSINLICRPGLFI
jgi:hypothetical protein